MKRAADKKSHMTLGIILVIILLIGIALVSVNIKTVTVTGNSRYSSQQMTDLIFQNPVDWNSTYRYVKERMGEHIEIPFVEDYKIVFHSPLEVEIIVYEKSVVGYVSYMNCHMYFDKDGIIVESTNERLEGIPCISGLSFGHIVLHKPLPVESEKIFQEILNLTQVLSVHQLKVDKIHYAANGEPSLYMADFEVILGDSSNINGKIAELSDMLPQLEGLSGTLHLETYDEINGNMMYTFKKKLQNY